MINKKTMTQNQPFKVQKYIYISTTFAHVTPILEKTPYGVVKNKSKAL